MYSFALTSGSLTEPGPLRTKKSPSGTASHPLPLQIDGLGAPLAAHDAHGLALYDLRLGIDAGAGAVAEPVPHDLRQVSHELVIAFELIAFDADDRPVVGHADQEIAALGIEEGRNRLERRVRDVLVILPVLLEIPAQRGLELQRLRLAALDQLLGIAVRAKILVEEEVFAASPKARSSVMRL